MQERTLYTLTNAMYAIRIQLKLKVYFVLEAFVLLSFLPKLFLLSHGFDVLGNSVFVTSQRRRYYVLEYKGNTTNNVIMWQIDIQIVFQPIYRFGLVA